MKTITQQELNSLIDDHEIWIKTMGKEGKKLVLIGYDLSGRNLSNSNLSKSNLSNCDLYKSNLSNCDLSNSNLSYSNLSNCNLYNSNLSNCDLSHTEVFTFTLGRHMGWCHFSDKYDEGSYVRIGCHGYSLKEWLKEYEEIGRKEKYSKKEVERYGIQLKGLKKIYKLN